MEMEGEDFTKNSVNSTGCQGGIVLAAGQKEGLVMSVISVATIAALAVGSTSLLKKVGISHFLGPFPSFSDGLTYGFCSNLSDRLIEYTAGQHFQSLVKTRKKASCVLIGIIALKVLTPFVIAKTLEKTHRIIIPKSYLYFEGTLYLGALMTGEIEKIAGRIFPELFLSHNCERTEIIPLIFQKLVFDCVDFTSKFLFSLAPCLSGNGHSLRAKNFEGLLVKFPIFETRAVYYWLWSG